MKLNTEKFLKDLEEGHIRAAEKMENGEWKVNLEVKENILTIFRTGNLVQMGEFVDMDTIPKQNFVPQKGVRIVPSGSSVRRGSYLAKKVIMLSPSYVNIGAYVDEGTLIDSHVLVGSCAQIGKNVHLSAGVQIGGVLEPAGKTPVIIEDDAFLGANGAVVDGIRVGRRAILAPGVILSQSVSLYDAVHEKLLPRGAPVPDSAVVVPGSRPLKTKFGKQEGLQIYCPIIIKYRDEKTDAALTLEKALR